MNLNGSNKRQMKLTSYNEKRFNQIRKKTFKNHEQKISPQEIVGFQQCNKVVIYLKRWIDGNNPFPEYTNDTKKGVFFGVLLSFEERERVST